MHNVQQQYNGGGNGSNSNSDSGIERQSDTANKLSTRIWIALRQLFKLYLFLSDYVFHLCLALTLHLVFIFIRCRFELNLKFSCYIWMGSEAGGAAERSFCSFLRFFFFFFMYSRFPHSFSSKWNLEMFPQVFLLQCIPLCSYGLGW